MAELLKIPVKCFEWKVCFLMQTGNALKRLYFKESRLLCYEY